MRQEDASNSTLKAALDYCRRGWPVFPCRWEDESEESLQERKRVAPPGVRVDRYKAKGPLTASGHKDATNNAEQVKAWWERWPKALIGMPTGKFVGIWVLDVDLAKREGQQPGDETLAKLEAEHGPLPETVEQRTGSGGRHLFFLYPPDGREVRSSAKKIGPGLDIRGDGGYIILPPSGHPSGGFYEWLRTPQKGTKFVEAPAWLLNLVAKQPTPKQEDTCTPVIELDQPENVLDAVDYLRDSAPLAIEGEGGNDTTYKVAAELRGRGISQDTSLTLMGRYWNERCEPPWGADDLARTVANAFRYARLEAPGEATAEAAFAECWVPPEVNKPPTTPEGARPGWITYDEFEAKLEAEKKKGPLAHRASAIDPDALLPRDWIVKNRFAGKYVTVTVAPGGGSKSTLSTLEAISIVTGRPLSGMKVMKQGAVWLYNAEDPSEEIQRKIAAACMHSDVPLAGLDNLHYRSGQDERALIFVRHDANNGLMVHQAVVDDIVKYIQAHGIVLMVLDPFIRTHRVNENDNMQIDAVIAVMSRVANVTGCAIHIVHHTRKLGGEGGIGDAETARGASSNVSAARVAHTLNTMTEKEAEKFGVPKEKASFFVRLDDAKANFSAPGKGTVWYERAGVLLPNGQDEVGVLRAVTLKPLERVKEDPAPGMFEALTVVAKFVPVGETRNLNEVVKHVLDEGTAVPFIGVKAPTSLRRRFVEHYLADPVEVDGVQLSLRVLDDTAPNNTKVLVYAAKAETKVVRPDEF